MAQPPPYNRLQSFTGFSAFNPSDQQPGVWLDSEYNAIKLTLDAILANLVLLQRDDGRLANALVSLDTLATDVLAALGGTEGWAPRGAWLTATSYAVGDVVTQSNSTYVCAVAHTSGTFSTDLAAVRWIAIFSAVASSLADGSVTTTKIADGAVTAAKLGFTSLTLTGAIESDTALLAGTATAETGYVVSGKADTGNVFGSIARATQAQGVVGFRIAGGTSSGDWFMQMPGSANTLQMLYGAQVQATFQTAGNVDWAFTQRVTGAATPASGSGLELSFASSTGTVQAYNRTGGALLDLRVAGLSLFLAGGGVDWLRMTGSAPSVLDASGGSYFTLGYRNLPVNGRTGAYTLALSDVGKMISNTTGGVVIPANGAVAFSPGDSIVIYNDSNSNQTISITTDTLRWGGTSLTGSRTLLPYGLATVTKVKSTEWVISGSVT
jgi:hypothetical protein